MRKKTFHPLFIAMMGMGVLSSCFSDYADEADLKVVVNKVVEDKTDWQALAAEVAKLDQDLRAYYEKERMPKTESGTGYANVDHYATLPDGTKMAFIDLGLESGTLWAAVNLGSNALKQDYGKTLDNFLDASFKIPTPPVFTAPTQATGKSIIPLSEYKEKAGEYNSLANANKEEVEKVMQEYREKVYECNDQIFNAAERMRADYNNFHRQYFFGTTNGDTYLWGNAEPVSKNSQLKAELPLELSSSDDPVTRLLGEGYATPTVEQFNELIFRSLNRDKNGPYEFAVSIDNFKKGDENRAVILPVFAENGITAATGYYYMVKDRTIDENGQPMLQARLLNERAWGEEVIVPITADQHFYVRAVKIKK